MNIAILILAAGKSSRMGQTKQLLKYGDTTLLGTAIQKALQSGASHVYVVLGAEAKLIQKEIMHYPVDIIMNTNFEKGLSSSIVAGIQELMHYDAVLVTLADQPKVDADYLNTLMSKCKEHPDSIIASNYNDIHGVPALFPKNYYTELLNLEGDKGAKSLLNSKAISVITANSLVDLLDIDTTEAYQELTKHIK